MLKIANFLFCIVILSLAYTSLVATASAQKKTIILVRHAEKDSSPSADPNDPALSPEGRERAEKLAKRIKGYHVGAVYSSNYRRTKGTAEPVAKRRKKEIAVYDPRNQQALIEEIMKSNTKRVLVVGHSNTIPALANLLVKKELFKNLEENEFGAIWVIKLRPDKPAEVKVMSY
jgi:2,3-bisphosphoglycerate-dependent phosphoglycerate mutase